jgi:TolB protein
MSRNHLLRSHAALLFATLPAIVVGTAYAQNPGGSPGSVVFYSIRDGHPNNQIYVMDPDGANPMRITFDAATDLDPDISTDGKSILYTSDQTGNKDIFVIDSRGATLNLTNNPATDEWARWSPNGKQIVFDSNRDGGVFEIFVMNADGSGLTQLTHPPVLARYPGWSPDGKQIVFRKGIDIYTMNSDGGAAVPLTSEVAPAFAQMPVWSPNGKQIAFMSLREGYCAVFLMNSDGSNQTNLTPKNPSDSSSSWCSRAPAWSADGKAIYFMSFRPSTSGLSEIFSIEPDGTNTRQLSFDGTSGEPRAR